jgi:septin family protein
MFPGATGKLISSCFFVEMLKRTIQIDTHKVDIEEKGIKLKLTVVDTPGYGDAIDNSNWYSNGSFDLPKGG